MIKIKLPTQEKSIINGKLETIKGNKEFILDMSLQAQMRFEVKFPELAKREDLLNYSQRISEVKELSFALLISKLKLVYCWFDTEISFKEFTQMFDLSDGAYVDELAKAIKETFDIVFNSSAEKN